MDRVIPLNKHVLVRKDEDADRTKGGILLPDDAKTPTLTGRIVAIAPDIQCGDELPIRDYDRVIVKPRNVMPVEIDPDNKLWLVPIQDIVGVYQRNPRTAPAAVTDET